MTMKSGNPPACAICGGEQYQHRAVLWPGLVDEWELDDCETAYIDRQQGTLCVSCGGNVRSIALASALVRSDGFDGTMDAWLAQSPSLSLLEVNEAGTLHARLSRLPHYTFGAWPEFDLQAIAYADESFDRIVHSDTLEHVPDAMAALREMRRVLKPGGSAVFTVPIVFGRMTRRRDALPPSFHGDPANATADLLVHTEFGADVWTMVLAAGFARCDLVSFDWPAGVAIVATR